MAETAKILNPTKQFLRPDAGCSLSDSCPAEQLAEYKAKNPDLFVVAYVNCSAAVKALSDVICTSGNAVQIVKQVPEDREILFVPDQNLGQWVIGQTGRKMRLWPGSCYAHVLFTKESIERCRIEYPSAPVVAHPECVQTVRDLADEVCSTEKMVHTVRSPLGHLHYINGDWDDASSYQRTARKSLCCWTTGNCACNNCRFMKMNTIPKLLECLRSSSPEISMDTPIIESPGFLLKKCSSGVSDLHFAYEEWWTKIYPQMISKGGDLEILLNISGLKKR